MKITDFSPENVVITEYYALGHNTLDLIEEGPGWWKDFKQGVKQGYQQEVNKQRLKQAADIGLTPQEPKQDPNVVEYTPPEKQPRFVKNNIARNWSKLDQSEQSYYQTKYVKQIQQFVKKNPRSTAKILELLKAELNHKERVK